MEIELARDEAVEQVDEAAQAAKKEKKKLR